MMNELISITKNENGELLVSARELHEALKVEKAFSTWIQTQLKNIDAIENEDFVPLKEESRGGRPGDNYILKLDTAKEICMVVGAAPRANHETKKLSKSIRKYFIECEKQLRKQTAQLSAEDRTIVEIIHQVKAGNVPQAVGTVLEYGQEKYDEGYGKGQNDKEEELQPVIEFAEVFEKADGKLKVREAAKLVYDKDRINVGERKLHALLRYWGWELYNGSSTTEPSQNAIKSGWLIAKPITRYNKDSNRYHVTYTPYVTPKGLALITKKLLKMSTSDVNQIYKEDKIKMKKFKKKA